MLYNTTGDENPSALCFLFGLIRFSEAIIEVLQQWKVCECYWWEWGHCSASLYPEWLCRDYERVTKEQGQSQMEKSSKYIIIVTGVMHIIFVACRAISAFACLENNNYLDFAKVLYYDWLGKVIWFILINMQFYYCVYIHYIQDEISPIDIAHDCIHPKAIKVLTQLKYGSFTPRAPWNRNGMRNSSSYTGVSSHRSESMHSVNSYASRSSACSDIGRYTLSNHTCSIPENDIDKDWWFVLICCVFLLCE